MGKFRGHGMNWFNQATFTKVFMKLTVLLLILSFFVGQALAAPDLICSLYHSKRVIKIASEHSSYDKNRHCTVSCMLALKCPDQEVMMIGLLKEIKDFFGPGEADVEDLKADAFGISLASKRAATSGSQCLSQCDLYYHQ